MPFAMSGIGTTRTCQDVFCLVDLGWQADIEQSAALVFMMTSPS